MDVLAHIRLLARYDQWMNQKVYDAAAQLRPEQLAEDRGAFFGSLLNTLNHLVVTDMIWGHRLGAHPLAGASLAPILEMERPTALNQVLHQDLPSLWETRQKLDRVLIGWTEALSAMFSRDCASCWMRSGEATCCHSVSKTPMAPCSWAIWLLTWLSCMCATRVFSDTW